MSRLIGGVAALLLLILTLCLFPPYFADGDLGFCLASPNQWHLPRFLGWLLNALILVTSVAVMASAAKRHNFLSTGEDLMPGVLLFLLAACCFTTSRLSSSTMLLLGVCAGVYILFSTYESLNATRQFFLLATFVSIGAMFQYAFLILIPVYVGGGLMMKSFRLREAVAFVLGLAAPYWIVVGLGWVSLDSFHLPEQLQPITSAVIENDLFYTLLTVGVTAVMAIVLALYNGVRLFNRNERLRSMHWIINLTGILAVAAIIFDFTNFTAYYGTVALWLSVQVAAMMSLYELRSSRVWLIVLAVLYLPLYILTLC